jgi:AraC family chitin signaling transcriptional activator
MKYQRAGVLKAVFSILLACSFSTVMGADEGTPAAISGAPRVIHYTKKQFNGDPQFWTMCQDRDGVLYFGNNDGALIFDGERWQTVRLPNNSSIRALKTSKDGTVYAGGFNELGIIRKNNFGQYHYESLTGLLRPEDRNIENIWQIDEVQGHMVFRSFRMLIAISNNKAVTLPTSSVFYYSSVVDNTLYVKDSEGLKSLDLRSMEFRLLFDPRTLNGEDLLVVLPGFQDELLAITKHGSVFKIDSARQRATFWQKFIPENSSNLITCAIRSSTGNYYLGTLSTQVLTLSKNGDQLTARNAFPALQDNTVLNLFESSEGNIWALLNNGIDYIDITSPVSTLFENASIYDALPVENSMYLATNQGVLFAPSVGKDTRTRIGFENINGLEGQAWLIQKFQGRVLCSHDRGLFLLEGNSFKQIPDAKGVWKVIEIKSKPGHYLVCAYDGLFLMQYDPTKGFEIKHKLEGFNESSRDILQSDEPGVFWVCHGYKGVFRIRIDDSFRRVVSLEHFKDKNGLPSPFNINVFRWKNEIIFTTNHGIYTYHAGDNKFLPHRFLTDLFGTALNVRKLFQHGDKTWFVHDNEVGYFVTDAPQPVLEKGLFLQLRGSFNPSMECIVPLSENNVLIGTNVGLYAFNLVYDASVRKTKTLLTMVSYRQPSAQVFCPLSSSREYRQVFPFNTSGIVFSFSAPGFQDRMNIQYSYKVEGIDDQWSPWQQTSQKEYSLLRPGKYVFRVKARSLLGETADETAYYFEIMPAWYQTGWAIAAYCVLALACLAVVTSLVKRRIKHEREKTLAEEKEKRKVLELEIERIKLEREKEEIKKDKDQLEEDVIYKSKELANYTMLLVKKRELLIEMHDELNALKELARNDTSRQKLRELTKKINANLQNEEHIQVFEANFERVHHVFFTELKTSFPDLTQKELRLCAFVRMNLTNKEIASILNISVRGVETARYRLRKRLSLNHEEDMVDFLEKLYSSNSEVNPVVTDQEEGV